MTYLQRTISVTAEKTSAGQADVRGQWRGIIFFTIMKRGQQCMSCFFIPSIMKRENKVRRIPICSKLLRSADKLNLLLIASSFSNPNQFQIGSVKPYDSFQKCVLTAYFINSRPFFGIVIQSGKTQGIY